MRDLVSDVDAVDYIDQSFSIGSVAVQAPIQSSIFVDAPSVIASPILGPIYAATDAPATASETTQIITPYVNSGAIVSLQDVGYAASTVDPTTQQPASTIPNPLSATTTPAGQSFGVLGWAMLAFGAYWLMK